MFIVVAKLVVRRELRRENAPMHVISNAMLGLVPPVLQLGQYSHAIVEGRALKNDVWTPTMKLDGVARTSATISCHVANIPVRRSVTQGYVELVK